MHKKSSFIKNNKFAPLISDVLPYETPIKFSNTGIYKVLRKNFEENLKIYYKNKARGSKRPKTPFGIKEFFIESYFPKYLKTIWGINNNNKNNYYTIPYKYKIKHGNNNYRDMSLLHPISQYEICDFYNEYKELIIYNTNKSSYSLRFPYKVSKIVHRDLPERKVKLLKAWEDAKTAQTLDVQEEIVEDANISSNTQDLISTFFVYKKYSHLFKFYESAEYLNNEKRFLYLTKLDIVKFFNSIYTHTISWAVKNKEYAKNNTKDQESFECKFDKLMQHSNYNETNGIPIGAEVSRIFAEIIMQSIDLSIEKKLENEKNSFKIYRYVDDYFVFYNDKQTFNRIAQILKEELKHYNLFLNDAKTINLERPFITSQTIMKEKLKILIDNFLNVYEFTDDKIKFFSKTQSANSFLIEYRILLSETNVSSSDICNFLLAQIQKKLIFIFSKILKNEYLNAIYLECILMNIITIIYYVFATTENASATYKLYKITYFILGIAQNLSIKNIYSKIKEKILQETLTAIEIIENKSSKILIEQLDILLILKQVETNAYKLSEKRLEKLFNIEADNLSYFEIVVLLDYINNDNKYKNLKNKVIDCVKRKLSVSRPLLYAENFYLLFDLIKSPYIDDNQKKQMLKQVDLKINFANTINEIKSKEWFYDWNSNISIKELLEVKEWTPSYF